MVLSSNYSQFIIDAAHAALFASMLVFFYFDRGTFFFKGKRPRGHDDAEGTWGAMNKTRPAITESFYCQVGPADVAEWPVSRLVEYANCR